MDPPPYDPFGPGEFTVGVRTFEAPDPERGRVFECEIWYPAAAVAPADGGAAQREAPAGGTGEFCDATAATGEHPVVLFSHFSGGGRRTATYLTTHLASHGYAVAAMDHSEVAAAELRPRPDESAADRSARIDAVIGSRVPDLRLLLACLLGGRPAELAGIGLDEHRIAAAGHSFGGWTALAAPEREPLIAAVVALAPGGSSRHLPGVLPLTLAFGWERGVPLLILAAERDVPTPLDGVQEVFTRAPEPKRMFVLRRADHEHFADDPEGRHEALRAMTLPGEAAWITTAMLPSSELCPAEHGHIFTRGLALAHLDAALRGSAAAEEFLASRAERALAARGIDAAEYRAPAGT
jgi:dienelactone hydrolase